VFGGHEGVGWGSKIFKEQRSSPLCEVLTVEVCESACPSPAKNKFNAEAPALKRKKNPVNIRSTMFRCNEVWVTHARLENHINHGKLPQNINSQNLPTASRHRFIGHFWGRWRRWQRVAQE